MQEIYKRRLSPTEAKRHYVYIENDALWLFPFVGKPFKIRIGKKEFEVAIGSENRIWATLFWEKLPHFREGDTIFFLKKPDGSFYVGIEE